MHAAFPDPEALLEHAGFLRRLARGLVGDPDRAEDLVQETWVAALERPPARRTSARGWLASVAKSRAVNRARADGRRREHESRRAEEHPTDDAASKVERDLELERAVVDALAALREPYRSTLHARYYEELTPRAIAKRDRVPVSTVKTRLHRGLGLLRDELDRRHGGRRGAWSLVVATWAQPSPAAAGVASGLVSIGGLFMLPKLLAAAGAVLALVAVVVVANRTRVDSIPTPDQAVATPSAGLETPSATLSPQRDRESTSRDVAVVHAPESIAPSTTPANELPGAWVVGVGRAPGAPLETEVYGALFRCDDDGEPLDVLAQASLGPDGAFRFRTEYDGAHLVVVVCDGYRPACERVVVAGADTYEVATLSLDPGASIGGEVVLTLEDPDERFRVHVGEDELEENDRSVGPFELRWTGDAFEHADVRVDADEDGRFRATGLSPGRKRVHADAESWYYVFVPEPKRVVAPAEGVLLGDELVRVIFTIHCAGVAVPKAEIRVVRENGYYSCWADREGNAELWTGHSGIGAIQVSKEGFATRELSFEPPLVGQDIHADVALERSFLPATLVLLAGDGPAGRVRRLTLTPVAVPDAVDEIRRDLGGDGPWRVGDLPPGTWRATVDPAFGPEATLDGVGYLQPASFEVTLPEGGEIHRAVTFEPGGRIRFRAEGGPEEESWAACDLTDSLGKPADTRFMQVARSGNSLQTGTVTGSLCISHPCETWPSIPPGDYVLVVRIPGRVAERFDVRVVAGRTTAVVLTLD